MKRRLLLLATTLCLLAPDAFAQSKVPSLINYQGNVRTAAGVPIGNGTATNRLVTFRFYKSPTSVLAADRLWSESQTATILDGNFNVLIGGGAAVSGETNAVTPFANVFSQNSSVYLGITVDDGNAGTVDAEISPRQQLVSGAFAFRATVAESVDNLAITTGMLSSNSVTTNQLGAAAVTTAKIANDAITSVQILNGTIGVDKLGTGAVTADKILDGTIASADIAADTITAGDIAPGAVASSEILDGTIATADIADSAVTGAKVATDTLVAGNIAAGAVGTSEIADGSITASDLGAAGITGDETSQLRIVRGSLHATSVNTAGSTFANGVTKTGTGWSYTYNNTAFRAYVKVTFSPPFSATPTITVSNSSVAGRMPYIMRPIAGHIQPVGVTAPDANGFWYGVNLAGQDNCTDPLHPLNGGGMEFIAIGPR